MDQALALFRRPEVVGLVGILLLTMCVVVFYIRRKIRDAQAMSGIRQLKERKADASIEKAKIAIRKGKLDEAFDHLSKCPVDDEWVVEQIERIALKFEKQGKLDKAERVHAYLASQSTSFRQFSNRLPGEHTVMQMDTPAVQPKPQNKEKPVEPGVTAEPEPVAAPSPSGTNQKGGKVQYLGPYRLMKVLHRSSGGIVYKALDEKTNLEAAIKAFPVAQNTNSEERHQAVLTFANEARTLSQINHPNIARVLRVGKAEGVPFFATELLVGAPLAQHSAEGSLLSRQEVASIAVRVADVLQQVHERGLVHGDIRPGNIFYDAASDQLKVTDFGVARIATSIQIPGGGVIHGTPSYMSPEQISGRKVDTRSDLYSLCVTVYQLLCGRLPHGGESFNDLIYVIATTPAPDIRTLNPQLPSDLTEFFHKGLAKNPNQRFQTGHDLAAALRKALAWD